MSERVRAAEALECIDRLESHSDFTGYYLRRLGEKIARQEEKILTRDCDEKLEKQFLAGMKEARDLLKNDAASSRSVLGIEGDEKPAFGPDFVEG